MLVSMLSCSVGRIYNITCYYHLVWYSSTTTFYPPVGSQCQYVNMHGTTSQKLHSKSKIIHFLFFFFYTHYCKKSWHQKEKSFRGRQHQTKNIYITHDRIQCPPSFTFSVSNTGVVGGGEMRLGGEIMVTRLDPGISVLCKERELVSVGWSCTAEFQASRLDTVQSRINRKTWQKAARARNQKYKKFEGKNNRR